MGQLSCRAELTDIAGLQPALPGMGRTGYPLAEEARAARLDHIQSPTQRAAGITAGHSPAKHKVTHDSSRAVAHGPGAPSGAVLHSPGASSPATADSPEASGRAAEDSPGPVAEGLEDHPNVELSRFSYAASIESCDVYGAPAPVSISRYERNPPPETVEGKPGTQFSLAIIELVTSTLDF